jgi:hypothetical protein
VALRQCSRYNRGLSIDPDANHAHQTRRRQLENARQPGRQSGLLQAVRDGAKGPAGVAVCVPYPYLAQAGRARWQQGRLGRKDVSEHAQGAYTGEVSGAMLADFGCRYVLVGHSERRSFMAIPMPWWPPSLPRRSRSG